MLFFVRSIPLVFTTQKFFNICLRLCYAMLPLIELEIHDTELATDYEVDLQQ